MQRGGCEPDSRPVACKDASLVCALSCSSGPDCTKCAGSACQVLLLFCRASPHINCSVRQNTPGESGRSAGSIALVLHTHSVHRCRCKWACFHLERRRHYVRIAILALNRELHGGPRGADDHVHDVLLALVNQGHTVNFDQNVPHLPPKTRSNKSERMMMMRRNADMVASFFPPRFESLCCCYRWLVRAWAGRVRGWE